MPFIGTGSIAVRHKRIRLVTVEEVPDGEGGYVEHDVPMPPDEFGFIRPASTRDLERLTAGTVISQATHLVTLPFRRDLTTETVLLVENYPDADRRLAVLSRGNPGERDTELDVVCTEIVP